jgi:hypothetical protein
MDAIAAAEKYRDIAGRTPALFDFYHALAMTYERSAREMNLMLEKAEGLKLVSSEAA